MILKGRLIGTLSSGNNAQLDSQQYAEHRELGSCCFNRSPAYRDEIDKATGIGPLTIKLGDRQTWAGSTRQRVGRAS